MRISYGSANNVRNITLSSLRPSTMAKHSLIDKSGEVDELGDENFLSRAKAIDQLPKDLRGKLRTIGKRGPQLAPTKELITIRLSEDTVAYLRKQDIWSQDFLPAIMPAYPLEKTANPKGNSGLTAIRGSCPPRLSKSVLTQQRQYRLGHLVGLSQDRGTSLLQDLCTSHVRHFNCVVSVFDA